MNAIADVNDAGLVETMARGDQAGLTEVYRRHGAAMFGLARTVLLDRDLAQDVVQDVLVRLWQAPERFAPERGSLRSFLLAQVHSRSIDVVRSESKRKAREQRDAEERAQRAAPDAHSLVWQELVGSEVRAALAKLPEQNAQPIVLAYFAGYSYQHVARLLGQAEGTVKSRIRAGLKALAAALGDAESADPSVLLGSIPT